MSDEIISNHALPDDRPQVLRNQDYSTQELAKAITIATFKHKRLTKLTATEYNQWYVGSCVPHGFWTLLEYEGVVPKGFNPSQLRSYRKRSNYPNEGSNGVDMFNQIRSGQSNDFPTPEKFREAMATAMPYVLGDKKIKDFKFYQYIDKTAGGVLVGDIPADIAQGKAVAIFIYATKDEWSKQYVEATDPNVTLGNASVRHCVCVVPNGDFTKNGKRWLTIQDSAKFGGFGMRYVEYDSFIKNRVYFAAKVYAVGSEPVQPVIVDTKPVVACKLGDKGSAVSALQTFLNKQGKLEAQYLTGYYGAITAKAVLWWQLEHWNEFSVNIPKLLEWSGQFWGEGSITIVNK